jgi:hypothetical protein
MVANRSGFGVPTYLCSCLMVLMGCAQSVSNVKTTDTPSTLNQSPMKNGQTVTLLGVVTKVGTASGKTMAAWNGFDVGEMVYRFEPAEQSGVTEASFRLHVPERLLIFSYLNRPVRLKATVHVPAPVLVDANQPIQMPVSPSGAAIERETTLTAVDVAEVESN